MKYYYTHAKENPRRDSIKFKGLGDYVKGNGMLLLLFLITFSGLPMT